MGAALPAKQPPRTSSYQQHALFIAVVAALALAALKAGDLRVLLSSQPVPSANQVPDHVIQTASKHEQPMVPQGHGIDSTQQDVDITEQAATFPPLHSAAENSTCHLAGSVDECCNCTYHAVDDINSRTVYPILKQLVTTPFFRFFKVNLWSECTLWPEDGMCSLRDCSVDECPPHELPQPWLTAEAGSSHVSVLQGSSSNSDGSGSTHATHDSSPHTQGHASGGLLEADPACDTDALQRAAEADAAVDVGIDPRDTRGLAHVQGWRGLNNPWMAGGEDDESYLYINLLANPERYTGYQGEHAHRIWSAIYNQSCFTDLLAGRDTCTETRVFYRLISGMHASISAHIAASYLLDEERGEWGPSMQQYVQRLGAPHLRHRVENLYFAYLFVLRAVTKAAPLLERFAYDTGQPEQDMQTQQLMGILLAQSELHSACPTPFDEGRLWRGEQGSALLGHMQATFRNITRIMDCVGCEKCKLWGKLQTLGIATALKVLFSSPDCTGAAPDPAQPFADLQLERNEVIALVNLLERFAASLSYVNTFARQHALLEGSSEDDPSGQLTVH